MFGLIKQVSITLLSFGGSIASMANVNDHEKCISLNNQPLLSMTFSYCLKFWRTWSRTALLPIYI